MKELDRASCSFMVAAVSMILSGCCTGTGPNTQANNIHGQESIRNKESAISGLLAEIEVTTQKTSRIKNASSDWPQAIINTGSKARGRICSDMDYGQALERFSAVLERRRDALNKETQVYERWLFRDEDLLENKR